MTTQTVFKIYDIFDRRTTPIQLEVTIGHGQLGSTLLKLDSTLLGNFDNTFTHEIGPSNEMKNKTLNIFTTIHDIQPDTDKVSLAIKLIGGKKEYEQTVLDTTVPTSGAIATGVVTVVFI